MEDSIHIETQKILFKETVEKNIQKNTQENINESVRQCLGCRDGLANQEAHMEFGGCLYSSFS